MVGHDPLEVGILVRIQARELKIGGIMTQNPKPEEEKKEPPKPKTNKKIWWWVGGGCCFLLMLIVFFSFIAPFLLSLLSSSADIPLPNPSSTRTAISASPTSTPKTTPNQPSSEGYPQPSSCTPLQLVDSVPLDISPSDFGLKQDIDTHYYQVYGYTPNEVRAQLNACGAESAGEAYDAYTSYYINWTYNYQPVAAGCNIKDVTVGAKIDFFYPKWEDPGNAQPGLAERWQTYMTNLETHENGHKDIALEGAKAILNSLLALSDSATCDDAGNLANSTGQSIFADYDAQNKAYDAETGHGATQGAVFP